MKNKIKILKTFISVPDRKLMTSDAFDQKRLMSFLQKIVHVWLLIIAIVYKKELEFICVCQNC